MFDRDEYYETTARKDILAYINEKKEKASLNWVYGCLKEMIENDKITSQKIENIISDIENNPGLYWLDERPLRKEKLEKLKETIHDREL